MKEIYSDKYYENDDVEDEEKPEFSDMSDVDSDGDDNYDDMEIGTKPVVDSEEEEAEAPEAAPSSTSHFREKKEGRRRKKRNSKFADAVKREKPLFDPKEKTFEEYFNEYYSLDYEDILGDTRTKFHYRPVPANSFGLTVDEILTTEDKRLNAWVSLRKATQYRTEQEESFDQRAYERKAQNAEKKHKILSDLPQKPKANVGPQQEDKPAKTGPNEEPAQEQETEAGDVEEKTGKKRRRRNKNKNAEQEGDTEAKDVEAKEELEEVKEEAKEALKKAKDAASQKSARTRKRKHKSHEGGKGMKRPEELENISDERLQAYGLNPKKFVNKFHHQKKRKQEQQMA
ncbi:hypothetical protein L596_028163 [Steinernema carpocapsae]|uniref:Protein KRI1 homolog n=1 Tax=Steinernema carpocapsae TaxID=34508 RepID=A0A4U5LXN8_STECR|nr:hypothetical protein L596_028163 [Steinernema carpocapsae]